MNWSRTSLSRLGDFWRSSTDLFAVVFLVLLTNLVMVLPATEDSLIRAVLGIAFVLFAPGYGLVSTLFPEARRPFATAEDDRDRALGPLFPTSTEHVERHLDGFERVAFAVALSIAVVALLVFTLALTPFPFTMDSALVLVSFATIFLAGLAAIRRWQLPAENRFTVSFRSWVTAGISFVTNTDSRVDSFLNVGLVVAMVLALGTLSFAVVAPPDGSHYTDFYVLTENDEGELVAADYPSELITGESTPLTLGIDNQEHEESPYSIIVELQRVQTDQQGNETQVTVTEKEQLRQIDTRVGQNQSWQNTYQFEPSMTGENLRLTFLLYKGDPPVEPTVENSYRDLHIWVSVDQPQTE